MQIAYVKEALLGIVIYTNLRVSFHYSFQYIAYVKDQENVGLGMKHLIQMYSQYFWIE